MNREEAWKAINADMEQGADEEEKPLMRALLFLLKEAAEDLRQIRLHYANDAPE